MLFHPTLCARYTFGRSNAPQVLGTRVPSFGNYPHQASQVLTLYREFWRLVMLHPPSEQPDLAVRLRNEFRKGRLLRGTSRVNRAVLRAEDQLQFFRNLVDTKAARFEGRCVALLRPSFYARRKNLSSASASPQQRFSSRPQPPHSGQSRQSAITLEALSVDGAWAQLQHRAQGAVPGLPNLKRSRPLTRIASPLFNEASSSRIW